MNCKKVAEHITNWLVKKLNTSKQKGFVIGVSGGIDSAVVSALCAKTDFPVVTLNMPVFQNKEQYYLSVEHINWLKKKFKNVSSRTIDLSSVFSELICNLPENAKGDLALANIRSRLRMVTLYAFANTNKYLVCGTGNKIEDFGVGFFTKYGDGGVDINPIGDLLKSEVYALGKFLDVPKSIQKAAPTDGLWEKDKTDEEQIGATYNELEWAMKYCEKNKIISLSEIKKTNLTKRQTEVLKIYVTRHNCNKHKIKMPDVCKIKS
ncbi:MAG: NAD(+) synthase [Bacteroidales bacterium]|nr:NAD(+) synthase [Bacteroidales bacterium]